MKVLVTSAEWKSALSVMRSLARLGHEVWLVASDPLTCHLYSKFCAGHVISPKEEQREEYLSFLLDHVKEHAYDWLIPISGVANEYVIENQEELSRYTQMVLPPIEMFRVARDKAKTYRFAMGQGIPIPPTHFPEKMEDVQAIAKKSSYPCVVKLGRGAAGSGNTYIFAEEELLRYFQNKEEGPWPVIQKFATAKVIGLSAICCEGAVGSLFLHEKVQQYPQSGGVTVYGRSVADESLKQRAIEMIQHFNWHGPICADFFLMENGELLLIEINPRFSGAVQFAMNCGVDVPAALERLLTKNERPSLDDYPKDKYYRALFTEEVRSCVEDTCRFLRFFLNFLNPKYSYDFSWRDPKLFLWQLKKAKWDYFLFKERKKHAKIS